MSEDTNKIIGKRIKEILGAQGKTQAWLAGEMGIEAGYLSELINGKAKKRWNTSLIEQARIALGVKLSDLASNFSGEDWNQKIAELEEEYRNVMQEQYEFLLSKSLKNKGKS